MRSLLLWLPEDKNIKAQPILIASYNVDTDKAMINSKVLKGGISISNGTQKTNGHSIHEVEFNREKE